MAAATVIVRFSALGDIALALPPVYALCHRHPERSFLFVTRPHPSRMFVDPPANLQLVTPDLSRYRGVGGLWRLWRELRRDNPGIDRFVDLHDVLRTKVLCLFARLSGVSVSVIDKHRRQRRCLTQRRCPNAAPLQLPHVSVNYASALGLPAEADFVAEFNAARDKKLAPTDSGSSGNGKNAGATDSGSNGSNKNVDVDAGQLRVAIAPFAAHRGKVYPADKMGEVIRLLAANPRLQLLIFGFGEGEAAQIDRWHEAAGGNIRNMARERIGIAGELELMRHCSVMLSMDSGNMHLAALAGLPVITIWGATHPCAGFNGLTADLADALQLDMPCRPCSIYGNKPCRRGDYKCLNDISPQSVVDAIYRKLRLT